jgi:excisionase family DNA binding protein
MADIKSQLDELCELCQSCDMPETPTATEWLTVAEAADILGCSHDTIRRHCDAGTLTATKTLGGHRRVSAESVAQHADTAA